MTLLTKEEKKIHRAQKVCCIWKKGISAIKTTMMIIKIAIK